MIRLSAEELRALVAYDQDTGVFTWLDSGEPVQTRDNGNGYLYARIKGRLAAVHRLAWLYMDGVWPEAEVDHRDTDKTNNRWSNLRQATRSQNEFNKSLRADSTSGFKGVSWHKCKSRWRAHITVNGRHISLGYHDTPELAHGAYKRAAAKHGGEFARHS